ncbi:putative peptidase M23 [Bacillus phage P59]|nr:putative peptidase M23 [Bacillus phage P59]
MVKYKITSRFLDKESFRDHAHSGLDFSMPEGTELKSIAEGVVRIKDFGNVNAGKTVLIDSADGKTYIYGHLKDFSVQNGDRVHVGDLIGHSGNTGHSLGPHLHLGVKVNGEFVDPTPYAPMIQQMDNLKAVAHNTTLDVGEIFSSAMQQFGDALSDMTINLISLLPSIPKVLEVLGTILFWLA